MRKVTLYSFVHYRDRCLISTNRSKQIESLQIHRHHHFLNIYLCYAISSTQCHDSPSMIGFSPPPYFFDVDLVEQKGKKRIVRTNFLRFLSEINCLFDSSHRRVEIYVRFHRAHNEEFGEIYCLLVIQLICNLII